MRCEKISMYHGFVFGTKYKNVFFLLYQAQLSSFTEAKSADELCCTVKNKRHFGTNTVAICVISRKPLNSHLLLTIPYEQKLNLSNWIIIHLITYVINSVWFNEYVFKISRLDYRHQSVVILARPQHMVVTMLQPT